MIRPGMAAGPLLALLLALPVVTAATDEAPATTEPMPGSQDSGMVAWLSGPFGAVPGGPIDQPATAEPDARALDTWMRQASLELVTDPSLESLASFEVVAAPVDGTRQATVLSRDSRWFEAPDEPGLHVITAVLESAAAGRSEHAWLVDVPDRAGSWETLLEMPMLSAELRAGGSAVSSEPGHGCYVGMCQEVGLRPPVGALRPLAVSVGQPLQLGLSDGSALVHWEGRLEPQPGTASETRLAQDTFDRPVASPTLAGLEPDAAGEWLLEVRADYDRERGWQWFLYRIVAH